MHPELEAIEKEIMALKEKRAKLRRELLPEPIKDYTLLGPGNQPISLRELFGDKNDLLVIHNMGKGCEYCTLWADGLNGLLPHLENRAAFVLVSPDDPETQAAFAASRGWKFRMLSSQGSDFHQEVGFSGECSSAYPGVSVYPGASAYHRDADGNITQTGRTFFGPGDDFCAVWPLFELFTKGANGWEPAKSY